MRWAQVLFSQGFGTRRECDALLFAGRVSHAGRTVDDPDQDVDLNGLEFEVEGRSWPYAERALVMLHKPAGYECSQRPGASPSVMTLLPTPLRQRNKGGVQAVGRLDVDTTGLLLLTDDGTLLHRLTSPKHHVPKVYEVTAKHPVDDTQIERLLAGVVLHDEERGEPRGGAQPVRAAAAVRTGETSLRLTLTEGKYHQVKRMLGAVGNRCEALHRSAIGTLSLPADLQAGQWRWLSEAELAGFDEPPLSRAARPSI